ncbi:O-antigen ligase family protein [Winogradskyella maritima]|uniref:O-antigen ligase family protein n=1 Tax=Winogradskyella maritima TaxID=1517766 RepID=A0ABV8AEV8_9FLAO|nr:O-antigen ligase family protein [Winogradskyella maritima]
MAIVLITLFTAIVYYFMNYRMADGHIKSIGIIYQDAPTFNQLPTIYFSEDKESVITFNRPYKLKKTSNLEYHLEIPDDTKLRKFRIYFEFPGEKLTFKLNFSTDTGTYQYKSLESLFPSGLGGVNLENEILSFRVERENGYLESSKVFSYSSDLKDIHIFFLSLTPIILLAFFFSRNLNFSIPKKFKLMECLMTALILSIFLPPPTYNIVLIMLFTFGLIKFRKRYWLPNNKLHLIITAFFLIYLVNNIICVLNGAKGFNTIERLLPLFLLSFLIPVYGRRTDLKNFLAVSLLIGAYLFVTSIIDFQIHNNLEFFSFTNFSKFLHPVYYSYLLFFSIIYILYEKKQSYRYLYLGLLFILLVFSGSKIVLSFTLLLIILKFLKFNIKAFCFVIVVVALLVSLPVKHRFSEILSADDISILEETMITDYSDQRLNGFTLRLLLWRETFATMTPTDYIFGKGVKKSTNVELYNRIENLGLIKHKSYNPHNQYVQTLWKTGIIGLIFLLMIPVYSFYIGLINKDKLMMTFALFMIFVMLSESIFGRVRGVYFFTTVLLILANTKHIYENSNTRNKRHTK